MVTKKENTEPTISQGYQEEGKDSISSVEENFHTENLDGKRGRIKNNRNDFCCLILRHFCKAKIFEYKNK